MQREETARRANSADAVSLERTRRIAERVHQARGAIFDHSARCCLSDDMVDDRKIERFGVRDVAARARESGIEQQDADGRSVERIASVDYGHPNMHTMGWV